MDNGDKRTYRIVSRNVNVGDLTLGGINPLFIQTMTNTLTADVNSTVRQIENLVRKGADIVRLAVPDRQSVQALTDIKKMLRKKGVEVPLVADVHYSKSIAEESARYVEKVRVNPGNFIAEQKGKKFSDKDFETAKEKIFDNIQPLLKVCKRYGTALRIGVNWGSLSERILYNYGNTPEGMKVSAMEFVEVLTDSGFYNFTLSLKASDVRVMQEANILLVKEMIEKDLFFPVHLGVTESGDGLQARIKSAAGIGALLKLGIGDTVRVSLTEDPVNEIPVAEKLVRLNPEIRGVNTVELKNIDFKVNSVSGDVVRLLGHNKPPVISKNDNAKADFIKKGDNLIKREGKGVVDIDNLKIFELENKEEDSETFLVKAAAGFSCSFLKDKVNAIYLHGKNFEDYTLEELSFDILQAMGLRYSKAEFIACPSCGRSLFNVERELKKLKNAVSDFKGVKFAVMGCMVNGPGEMADADYGIVGSGKNKVTVYKDGKPVIKNIPTDEAIERLRELVDN